MMMAPVWVAVLLVLVSVPLVMKKVKPNWLYGFRTAKTMSDERIWYDANRLAGINMIVAAVLVIVFWCVSAAIAGKRMADFITLPVVLVAVLAAAGVSFVQLRKL